MVYDDNVCSWLLLFSIVLTPHIALLALFKIANSFSLRHHVSLPYSITIYTILINPTFHFQRKLSSIKQFPLFSKYNPSNFCFWCHRCSSSTTGIQPVFLNNNISSQIQSDHKMIFLSGSKIPLIISRHCSQTKAIAIVEVTLLIFTHLPGTHLPHFDPMP